jgi:hypothetical protein
VIDDEEVARRMWASKQSGAENYYMVEMNGCVRACVRAREGKRAEGRGEG